jgi:hypothetical protein
MRLANLACTVAVLLTAGLCALQTQTVWAQELFPTDVHTVLPASQPAFFAQGFAELKDQLGELMGEPLELEHPPPDGGADMVQLTTTGLAAWTAGAPPAFTDGDRTWALADRRQQAIAPAASSPLVECIIWAESRGNPNAVNRSSGASGLGQFLASTWRTTPQGRAGLSVFDPAANRAAVAWMISVGRAGEFSTLWGCRR